MSKYGKTLDELFWSKVDKRNPDECWIWKASKRGKYGSAYYNGKRDGAHRISYIIHCGPIPDGMDICHRCDNPLCVNPAHLWVGTAEQNMHDMISKKRDKHPHGEHYKRHKLTYEQVQEIRVLLSQGELSQRAIAARYNISQAHVCYINTGFTWKHGDADRQEATR